MSEKVNAETPTFVLVPVVVLYWVSIHLQLSLQWTGSLVGVASLVAFLIMLWRYKKKRATVATFGMFLLGLFVFGWLGGHLFQMRLLPEPDGWRWTILSLGATWLTDLGAYVIGKFIAGRWIIGRHALAPRISPAKSVEGYIGGLMVGMIFVTTVGVNVFDYSLVAMLLLGGLVGLLSPLGDLSVSLLKRRAKVKDAGTLLPGHGGALDRTDTLFLGIPLAFYILQAIAHFGL